MHKVGQEGEVALEMVGGGEYDQNTPCEILRELQSLYVKEIKGGRLGSRKKASHS